jgi:hypothetical protein
MEKSSGELTSIFSLNVHPEGAMSLFHLDHLSGGKMRFGSRRRGDNDGFLIRFFSSRDG